MRNFLIFFLFPGHPHFLNIETYFYGVGSDKQVYRTLKNGSWKWFANCCVTKIIIPGDFGDFIYGIGTNGAVYRTRAREGGSWSQIATPNVIDIAYRDGHLFGVGTDNRVYRTTLPNDPNDGSIGSWSLGPGLCGAGCSSYAAMPVKKIFVHEGDLYGIGKDDNDVYLLIADDLVSPVTTTPKSISIIDFEISTIIL